MIEATGAQAERRSLATALRCISSTPCWPGVVGVITYVLVAADILARIRYAGSADETAAVHQILTSCAEMRSDDCAVMLTVRGGIFAGNGPVLNQIAATRYSEARSSVLPDKQYAGPAAGDRLQGFEQLFREERRQAKGRLVEHQDRSVSGKVEKRPSASSSWAVARLSHRIAVSRINIRISFPIL